MGVVIDKFFSDLNMQNLLENYRIDIIQNAKNSTLADKIKKLPEEVCCIVLERLKSMGIDGIGSLSHRNIALWHSKGVGWQTIEGEQWYVSTQCAVREREIVFIITVDVRSEDPEMYASSNWLSDDIRKPTGSDVDTPLEVYFNVGTTPHFTIDGEIVANWLKKDGTWDQLVDIWKNDPTPVSDGFWEESYVQVLFMEYRAGDFSNLDDFIRLMWREGILDEADITKVIFAKFAGRFNELV